MSNSFTLKDLADLRVAEHRKQYPNVPVHAIPRKVYKDTTANALTTAIVDFINLHGGQAYRQGNEGRYRQGETVIDVIGRARVMKGRFIPAHKRGIADVMGTYQGRTVAIEVKVGRDKQRPDQKRFESDLKRAGGVYFIADSWHGFWQNWRAFLRSL